MGVGTKLVKPGNEALHLLRRLEFIDGSGPGKSGTLDDCPNTAARGLFEFAYPVRLKSHSPLPVIADWDWVQPGTGIAFGR